MAEKPVWNKNAIRAAFFVAILSNLPLWESKLRKGQFSDTDIGALLGMAALVIVLYTTVRKLSKENEELKKQLDQINSKV